MTSISFATILLSLLSAQHEQIALVWTNSTSKATKDVYGGFGATDMGLATKALTSLGYSIHSGLANSKFTKAEADRSLKSFLGTAAKHKVLWISAIGSTDDEMGEPTLLCPDSTKDASRADVQLKDVVDRCGESIDKYGPITIVCDVGWGVAPKTRSYQNRLYTHTSKFLQRGDRNSSRVSDIFERFWRKGGVALAACSDGGVAYERNYSYRGTQGFASAFTQETVEQIPRLAGFGLDITGDVIRHELQLQFTALAKRGTLLGQSSVAYFSSGREEARPAFIVGPTFRADDEIRQQALLNLKEARVLISLDDGTGTATSVESQTKYRRAVEQAWESIAKKEGASTSLNSEGLLGPYLQLATSRPFSQVIRFWMREKPSQMCHAEIDDTSEDNFLKGSTFAARTWPELMRVLVPRLRYAAAVRRLYYQPEIRQLSNGIGAMPTKHWSIGFVSKPDGTFIDGDMFAANLLGQVDDGSFAFLLDRSSDTGIPRLLAPTCDVVDTKITRSPSSGATVPKNREALQMMVTRDGFGTCRVIVVKDPLANYAEFKRSDVDNKPLPELIRDSMFLENVVKLIEDGAPWSWSSKSYTMKKS
ncbi:MAG TPA: hypothetical protein PKA27_05770 [Fimbriimonadaceae bacterium]|nr:hypothetical protein [Fimbriimonadaceae bacterium]